MSTPGGWPSTMEAGRRKRAAGREEGRSRARGATLNGREETRKDAWRLLDPADLIYTPFFCEKNSVLVRASQQNGAAY